LLRVCWGRSFARSDLLYGCDLAGNPDGGAQIAAAVARAGERLRTLPLDIETADAIGWTYHELLRIAAEERPPRMVVLDYTQLVCAPEKVQEDARRTIATVAKVARTLARRGVVVLALSSTARANYDATSGTEGEKKRTPPGQGDPARFVALGKESGELEYTADVVMALAREPETDEQAARRLTGEARRVWLAIAKGRGFPAGWAPLSWNGWRFAGEPAGNGAHSMRTITV
jgi:replicative DNA helicase